MQLIFEHMSPQQLSVMLTIYCITGCDTVSTFFGQGKGTAFRLMIQHAECFQALQVLGTRTDVTQLEKSCAITFICKMYGHQCNSLNDLRCKISKNQKQKVVEIPEATKFGYEKDESGKLQLVLMSQNCMCPRTIE